MEEIQLYKKLADQIKKNQYYGQIINKEDKETVLNDTFIYIWKKINEGKLPNQWEEIEDYSYISCRNNCLSYLRKKKKQPYHQELESDLGKVYAMTDEYDDDVDNKINKILGILELEIDKKIINLRLEGYTLEEIGEELDIDLNRVSNINRNAINFVKRSLSGDPYRRKVQKIKNRKYKVVNIETEETIFVSYNKRTIADKFKLQRKLINKWIDTNLVFNQNLIIKSETFRNKGRKLKK